jgi:hypothetical protein
MELEILLMSKVPHGAKFLSIKSKTQTWKYTAPVEVDENTCWTAKQDMKTPHMLDCQPRTCRS